MVRAWRCILRSALRWRSVYVGDTPFLYPSVISISLQLHCHDSRGVSLVPPGMPRPPGAPSPMQDSEKNLLIVRNCVLPSQSGHLSALLGSYWMGPCPQCHSALSHHQCRCPRSVRRLPTDLTGRSVCEWCLQDRRQQERLGCGCCWTKSVVYFQDGEGNSQVSLDIFRADLGREGKSIEQELA